MGVFGIAIALILIVAFLFVPIPNSIKVSHTSNDVTVSTKASTDSSLSYQWFGCGLRGPVSYSSGSSGTDTTWTFAC